MTKIQTRMTKTRARMMEWRLAARQRRAIILRPQTNDFERVTNDKGPMTKDN
jgi:hypothetical protein